MIIMIIPKVITSPVLNKKLPTGQTLVMPDEAEEEVEGGS